MYLNKMEVGNPLINFELHEQLDQYEAAETDSELIDFYHRALTLFEERPFITRFLYAMIAQSTGYDVDTEKMYNHASK